MLEKTENALSGYIWYRLSDCNKHGIMTVSLSQKVFNTLTTSPDVPNYKVSFCCCCCCCYNEIIFRNYAIAQCLRSTHPPCFFCILKEWGHVCMDIHFYDIYRPQNQLRNIFSSVHPYANAKHATLSLSVILCMLSLNSCLSEVYFSLTVI